MNCTTVEMSAAVTPPVCKGSCTARGWACYFPSEFHIPARKDSEVDDVCDACLSCVFLTRGEACYNQFNSGSQIPYMLMDFKTNYSSRLSRFHRSFYAQGLLVLLLMDWWMLIKFSNRCHLARFTKPPVEPIAG